MRRAEFNESLFGVVFFFNMVLYVLVWCVGLVIKEDFCCRSYLPKRALYSKTNNESVFSRILSI